MLRGFGMAFCATTETTISWPTTDVKQLYDTQ